MERLIIKTTLKWCLDILKNIVILNRQAVHFSTGTAVHFSTGIYIYL